MTISKAKRDRILYRDYNKCLKCGSTENLSMDHINPKVLGGTDSEDNLQTLCGACNSKKGHAGIDYREGLE